MKKVLFLVSAFVLVSGAIAFASIGVNNNALPIGAAADIDCKNIYGIGCAVVNNDATIYLTNPLIDTALYTSTAGTGSSKYLKISTDGTIYATATP